MCEWALRNPVRASWVEDVPMSTLNVQPREPGVKPKVLRREGLLPLAIQRRDHSTITGLVTEADLKAAIRGADGLGQVEVQMAQGETLHAIVRRVDKDYIGQRLIHAVLQEVSREDTVKVDVPIVAIGTPVAVTDGMGLLVTPTDHVKLKGRIDQMPDHLEVDVTGLGVNEHVAASEVALPEGITLVSAPEAMLFTVSSVLREANDGVTPSDTTPEAVPESEGGAFMA